MNMAGFAANIGFNISSHFPCRVFSIQRSIWKFQIVCLKRREYSSSVPIRYISSTSCRVKILETALPVKSLGYCSCPDVNVLKINGGKDVQATIAHCEISQDPNEICPDLLFDDSEQDSFDQMEEVGELTIHEGGDSCDQELIQIDKFTSDVEEAAIKLLASRALTALELRKKLLGKRFSPDSVEAVINKFQRRGFINDRLYAETFSQSRWTSSSWGPRRIKQALFKKGVSQADAEKAVEVVFKDNDCAEDHKSVIGLSKHSMDHLYTQASKQWFRSQNVLKETRKSRIVRWLQYRGFDWNVINIILKKLDRQDQNSP
ncbi:hypothetical protein AAZX31_14G011300 [Glycine max]|uniref:Regulatory protein RecX n=1 Tax=Glycine soja TaxID=3848 RepID=A0A0B2QW25_GLYSO|nr:uncharacterized protein LOC114383121 isoform X1 [Glycine soja]KAG4964277.1 hypothetical protein JHK85_039252 [Glycine max]KHN23822.1 Regulatory protein recX [Glycine soja]RZB66889.1 hypothetical protein D0Y65_037343 [Glycine soja]